jgi:PKD repeat protein
MNLPGEGEPMRSDRICVLVASLVLALAAVAGTASAATVTGISPAYGAGGTTGTYYVYGSGFLDGAEVAIDDLNAGHGWVYATDEVTESPGRIRCTLTIPAGTAPAVYDVDVRNPGDTAWAWAADSFTVLGTLGVYEIIPREAALGTTVRAGIFATGLADGARVTVFLPGFGSLGAVEGTDYAYDGSTHMSCTLALPASLTPGVYSVSVQNPGMETWVTTANLFTVLDALTVTGTSPTSAEQGQTVTLHLYGTGFHGTGFVPGSGINVSISSVENAVHATDVNLVGPTEISCTLAIPSTLLAGSYHVLVANAGMLQEQDTGATFTVKALPRATGISPSVAACGTTVTADLYGTGFADGIDILFLPAEGVGVWIPQLLVTDVTVLSPEHVRCSIEITPEAPICGYAIELQNPGSTVHSRSDHALFTVLDPLTVARITPSAGARGTTIRADVDGTGFVDGAKIALDLPGHGPVGEVDGTDYTYTGSTRIGCTLRLDGRLLPGSYSVMVQNPGMSDWASNAGEFALLDPLNVTGISPNAAVQGETVAVDLYGTGFVQGTGLAVSIASPTGGTVSATGVTYAGPTHIACTLAIPPGQAPGNYAVLVANPGMSQPKSTGTTFGIHTAVAVSGISPSVGRAGASSAVTVSGTGFGAGAQVRLTGGGTSIDATGEATNGAGTEIACTLAIPADAFLGSYEVAVQNSGTSSWYAAADAFTVIAAPASVVRVPGGAGVPTDTNGDGIYDDVNGNGRADFADVVLYFNQMSWISANEPVAAFDCNGNGRIDFADVVWLFGHL